MGVSANSILTMQALNTLAIVFPGQGSQSVGMLADIAAHSPKIKEIFSSASTALGYDLWQLTQEGPSEKLDQTVYTQPALLASSYAVWQVLQEEVPLKPAFLAGHSLGEYTALVCAGALSFPQAIKLVAARGLFMQQAVPEGLGAMAAIVGLSDAAVKELCDQARLTDEVLSPANFNSVGQVVIAGHKASVEKATELAKQNGAKLAILLPVSVPSHCELMRSAAVELEALLNETEFKTPQIPVISNVEAKPYTTSESVRDGLVAQLYKPVRWVETVEYLVNSGITAIIECGPGKVLTGLNKRINKNLELFTTSNLSSIEALKK